MSSQPSTVARRMWGALSVGHPKRVGEFAELQVSVTSLRRQTDEEQVSRIMSHPVADFVRKSIAAGAVWRSAERVGTVLGLERVVRAHKSQRVGLGFTGMIPENVFDLLREGRGLQESTRFTLVPHEQRQVLFEISDPDAGAEVKPQDFFVLSLRSEVKGQPAYEQMLVVTVAQTAFNRA